ncbi:hypothetical protein ABW20_dc0103155 [Dactylellina cionopaga]|nr:hypothetical protein ABW20_dc0103155 [Dactylellina cionopaga]
MFVLVLDQVLDGGNLGAIIRSAYFLGVDAVVISTKNSAPATATTSRSSAGSLECIDFYHVADLASFIEKSKEKNWKFFGAMPSPSQQELKATKTKKSIKWYDLEGLGDPMHYGSTVLVMGNEAEGLRPALQKLMDRYVTIRKGNNVDEVVDSLNVGVAASILMNAFLYPAQPGQLPVVAKDTRTLRRLEAMELEKRKEMARRQGDNQIFLVDDGKYQVPRYKGTERLVEDAATGVDYDEDYDEDEGEELVEDREWREEVIDFGDGPRVPGQWDDEIEIEDGEIEERADSAPTKALESHDQDIEKERGKARDIEPENLKTEKAFEKTSEIEELEDQSSGELEVRGDEETTRECVQGNRDDVAEIVEKPGLQSDQNQENQQGELAELTESMKNKMQKREPIKPLTKKEIKRKRKESKHVQIQLRKKVRDDARKTMAALVRRADPPLLKDIEKKIYGGATESESGEKVQDLKTGKKKKKAGDADWDDITE